MRCSASAKLTTYRFSSIRLLLTNTLVPRDTKSLVAGVSAKRLAEPHIVDPIMEAIQEISDEAKHLLGGGEVERKQLVSRLEVGLYFKTSMTRTDIAAAYPG